MNLLASADGQTALHKVNGNLPTRTDGVTLRTGFTLCPAAPFGVWSKRVDG